MRRGAVILRGEPASGRLPLAEDTGSPADCVLSRSFVGERATKDLSVLGLAFLALAMLLPAGCGRSAADPSVPRVIVLGLDGMDHELTTRLMAEGRLPGISRLAEMGGFSALGTSTPPLSPVAWSNFITGQDAGVHGVFDFIHRDPKTMMPYLSTSKAEAPKRFVRFGDWQFPLDEGVVELLRRGTAFWEVLEKHGVPTTILRIPANFPPSGTATRELAGMGTPDILGTYGEFSYYTTDRLAFVGESIGGGKIHVVEEEGGVIAAQLLGPEHPLKQTKEPLTADFTLYLDPDRPLVKLVVGDEERILEESQWSDWVTVDFDLIPTQSVPTQALFYLKQVRPHLELYVSPLNLDPFAPAMPISTPESYAAELAEATGRYYTQGMPEDTGVLAAGVLSPTEFLEQAHIAMRELGDQLPWVLGQFDRGLLFYYVGNGDLVSHMMWRSMDPGHPTYDAERDAPFADVIPATYAVMDAMVSDTLDRMGDETLLIVMSDHGFTSWRRTFHLNAWLHQNGYLAVKDDSLPEVEALLNVDWFGTRAYGIGLNGLYINVAGRERDGIVPPDERDALLAEIAGRLEGEIDPWTGKPAVKHVYVSRETFSDGGQLEVGPDAVIAYTKGTRGADPSALGVVGLEILTDNDKPWSGDHGMDAPDVPGILATSRPLKRPAKNLRELHASVLAEFGLEPEAPQAH